MERISIFALGLVVELLLLVLPLVVLKMLKVNIFQPF